MSKKEKINNDPKTEEKILLAARNLFHQKGFAATRTRDIAELAGTNLALLNYYFRGKEKLFEMVMTITMQEFVTTMTSHFNDDNTSFEEKLHIMVSNYIDLFTANPDLPLFMLTEIRNNPDEILTKIKLKEAIWTSVFMQQLKQKMAAGQLKPVHPVHFIVNIIGLSAFPFIASPVIKLMSSTSDEDYNALMQERKSLIPQWIANMFFIKKPSKQ
jgi:AcrR family transcriptional regulator